MDMGTGMGLGMWLFWGVGIVGLLLVAKVLLSGSSTSTGNKYENPEEILERRFASGEISKDEFDHMKRELGNL